jgi:predicted nucleic acid-binding protein
MAARRQGKNSTMKCFVDTNVLVYKTDRTSPSKLARAQAWLAAAVERDALVLSAQSLREFYFAALRKDRAGRSLPALRAEIAALEAYVPELLRHDFMVEAWVLQDRHQFNFWDALLLASAMAAGCEVFLSEDMNAGQKIGALTVVNPFATTPESVLGV